MVRIDHASLIGVPVEGMSEAQEYEVSILELRRRTDQRGKKRTGILHISFVLERTHLDTQMTKRKIQQQATRHVRIEELGKGVEVFLTTEEKDKGGGVFLD